MLLYAYRRTLRGPESWDALAHDEVCIAEYDTVTHSFQPRDKHGVARRKATVWELSPNGEAEFIRWAREHYQWWSLDPKDAFWFDPDLSVDEGL